MEHTEQEKQTKLVEGLERLAFGNVTDAIKLLFCDELNTRILNKLDLFNISEIKRPKGGGIEIKFYDRLKRCNACRNYTMVSQVILPAFTVLWSKV